MAITLAVHPLVGQPLPVLRWVRVRGKPYVELRHPRGWTIRVPREWTEQGRPTVVPEVDGEAMKLDHAGLLLLAAYVREKLDDPEFVVLTVEGTADGGHDPAERRRPGGIKTADRPAGVGRGRPRGAPGRSRRTGVAREKDDPAGSRQRGGDR